MRLLQDTNTVSCLFRCFEGWIFFDLLRNRSVPYSTSSASMYFHEVTSTRKKCYFVIYTHFINHPYDLKLKYRHLLAGQ